MKYRLNNTYFKAKTKKENDLIYVYIIMQELFCNNLFIIKTKI